MYGSPPPKKSLLQAHRIQHLKMQQEHLILIRDYLRAHRSENPDITSTYQGIANLLDQVIDEYDFLMGKLKQVAQDSRT
jgi:hypothetical protein